MYICGLIPRNSAELAEAVPIAVTVSQQMKVANIMSSSQAKSTKSTSFFSREVDLVPLDCEIILRLWRS